MENSNLQVTNVSTWGDKAAFQRPVFLFVFGISRKRSELSLQSGRKLFSKKRLEGSEDFKNELKTNSKTLGPRYKFFLLGERLLKWNKEFRQLSVPPSIPKLVE